MRVGVSAFAGTALLYFAILFFHGNLGAPMTLISDYYFQVIMLAIINIIVTIGLNLINGFAGQFSIGQAGFMAVGAYCTAMLATVVAPIGSLSPAPQIVAFISIILISGCAAGFVGYLVGLPSLRLKGDYLAIVTLAFGEVVRSIVRASDEISNALASLGLKTMAAKIAAIGGPRGFGGFPQLSDIVIGPARIPTLFTLIFISVVLCVILARNLVYSSYGRAWLSVRGNELAAEAMGVNSTQVKVTAFVLSGFFAGVAGGFFAFVIRFLHPDSFSFLKSIEYLIFLYAGGAASLSGSIVSAGVLTVLPEFLRVVGFDQWRLVIYPVLLILIMLWRPSGLMGDSEFAFLRNSTARKTYA
jgi:branched-chain amino acid transport system permease protein